jgi:hypothetical protein
MNPAMHKIYIWSMVTIAVCVVVVIGVYGAGYYATPKIDRNLHELHPVLGPAGFWGHGMGFIGTAMMVVGVAVYSLRKRWSVLSNAGQIKHILEFHIFLCVLGPALVVYHTAFKFGGIVGVSFWCMVTVVASGVVGRYLYLQIPKSISGRDLTATELEKQNDVITHKLIFQYGVSETTVLTIDRLSQKISGEGRTSLIMTLPKLVLQDLKQRAEVQHAIKQLHIEKVNKKDIHAIESLFYEKSKIRKQITTLTITQKLFKHWHIIHLPFTIIMFIILIAHVVISFLFGYTWIFKFS